RRTKACVNRAAAALRLAANSLHASQSALGALMRRPKSRGGAPKAITATAHKLARLGNSLREHGTAYMKGGTEEYERRYQDRRVKNVSRRAKELGSALVQAAETSEQFLNK